MPYSVALFWGLEEVGRYVLLIRQLMLLCPISNRLKIPALMDGVEVDEGLWTLAWRLIPDLAKHANVNRTHQLLTQDIEAMC
jgi:hypothetical protein